MNQQIDELIFELEELNLEPKVYTDNVGETGGPHEIKRERDPTESFASTSGTKKRRSEYRYFRDMGRRGITQERKSENIFKWSDQFYPKKSEENPIPPNGMYLNLDCELDTKQALVEWQKSMQYFFAYFTDEESPELKFEMMRHAFKGNVQDWWRGVNQPTKNVIKLNVLNEFQKSNEEGVSRFVHYIASEFLGEDWIDWEKTNIERDRRRALINLYRLTICKMCYINEYTCEFQKYYYQLFDSGKDMGKAKYLYFMKLPPPWDEYFIQEFERYLQYETGINDTLGGRIKFVK